MTDIISAPQRGENIKINMSPFGGIIVGYNFLVISLIFENSDQFYSCWYEYVML